MFGQSPIIHLVHFVQDEIEEVESRDERRREINVGRDGQLGVVSRVDGVGSGEYGRAGVQSGDDARFGDRDGLLLLQGNISDLFVKTRVVK